METGFSLGSNLGDRLQFLRWAKTRLILAGQATFVGQSAVYETEPVDVADAYSSMKFLNAVLVLESSLSSQEWLVVLKKVELDLLRVRTGDRNAPRTIDIDILFSGDEIVDSDLLQIPHPRWSERRFVVEPLADVRPDLILPGADVSVKTILDQLPASDEVRLFAEQW